MNSKVKPIFSIVRSDKACISTELAGLIYDKVERNQLLSIETIQQELRKPKKGEEMELDEEQKMNSYGTL